MIRSLLLAFITIALFSACSSGGIQTGNRLSVDQDATVTIVGQDEKALKKGEALDVEDESVVFVDAPGYTSVVLVPVDLGEVNQIDLKLKSLEQSKSREIDRMVSSSVSDTFLETQKIQDLLAKGKTEEALKRIQELTKQYPKVTALKFLEATSYYITGNEAEALVSLERALKEYPDHESGRQLYKFLKGSDYQGNDNTTAATAVEEP